MGKPSLREQTGLFSRQLLTQTPCALKAKGAPVHHILEQSGRISLPPPRKHLAFHCMQAAPHITASKHPQALLICPGYRCSMKGVLGPAHTPV